jgi:hypothetical protein
VKKRDQRALAEERDRQRMYMGLPSVAEEERLTELRRVAEEDRASEVPYTRPDVKPITKPTDFGKKVAQ